MHPKRTRTTEWSSLPTEFTEAERHALAAAAWSWKEAHRLPQPPLEFGGIDGRRLITSHYVGVVEAGGVAVEIYPKLDKAWLRADAAEHASTVPVMRNLLWMLQVSGWVDLVETGTAAMEELPSRFVEVFAWLFARNLARELALGSRHEFVDQHGDLGVVRGRIDFTRQLTRLWNRKDRIACSWTEYSPDGPLNRLFKCACANLLGIVSHSMTAALLAECRTLLDEVADVSVSQALAEARGITWPRGTERFRGCHDLAYRLLSGMGHDIRSGSAETFVFLLDMNQLFEDYVAAAISARFGCAVEKQVRLGTLLHQPSAIPQVADTLWRDQHGVRWVGEAKYKSHLGAPTLLGGDEAPVLRGSLSAADIRQLTTYGGMLAAGGNDVALALFYPQPGGTQLKPRQWRTWNGLQLWICPVRVQEAPLDSVLRLHFDESGAF